jgi:hypothetical protein
VGIAARAQASSDPRNFGDVVDALDRLPLPIFAVDRRERIRWLNIAARALVGDRTGAPFARVVAPESLPVVRAEFVKKLLGTASESEYAAHLLHPDGTRVLVEISSVPIVDAGRIVGVFGAARTEDVEMPSSAPASAGLTPRQVQVLQLLARAARPRKLRNASVLHVRLCATTYVGHFADWVFTRDSRRSWQPSAII